MSIACNDDPSGHVETILIYYEIYAYKCRIFQTYFTKVIAQNSQGTTTVSSDGVAILPDNLKLQGVMVYDGPPCDATKGKDVLE